VLNLVHHHGPKSRAELTRATGLNRSTIADLVSELIESELVSETQPSAPARVGRPSPIVSIRSDQVAAVVNPDVDSIHIALVGLGGTVQRRVRYRCANSPTPDDAVNVVGAVIDAMLQDIESRFTVRGVGVAIPGLVDSRNGSVVLAPNLGWEDVPFAQMLGERLGLTAVAANEAQLGVDAERTFGAGIGIRNVLYLNGSEAGIGGGAVVEGVRLQGYRGYAAEFGHIVVDPDGEDCFCGQKGCLERCVRRERLERAVGKGPLDPDSLEAEIAASDSSEVNDEIDRQVGWVSAAIAKLVSAFAPQTVILGGFLGALLNARPDELKRQVLHASFRPLAEGVEIVPGSLGADAVLIGAAELAFEPLLRHPTAPTGRP
jgi:predicted NBD/HSP70 family sugar kinase